MQLGETLKAHIVQWLKTHHWEYSEWVYALIVAGFFLVTALVLHFLLHSVILRWFKRSAHKSQIRMQKITPGILHPSLLLLILSVSIYL